MCLFSDLEQLEVSSLCDGVVRFLQDLPGPVLPSSLQADMIRAVQGQIKADTPCLDVSSVAVGRVGVCSHFCSPPSVCRGPGPGGLCPGAAWRGQFTHLPGPVRTDPAQRGPTPGPSRSARLQKPAEPPKPGRELQPPAVQTHCRVGNKHTHVGLYL